MADGQVWEVVGGVRDGLMVRIAQDLNSPQDPARLSCGALVMEVALVGDRLHYNRIAGTGSGPDAGWVSIRSGRKDLLIPVNVMPPSKGWQVVKKELPPWTGELEYQPALTFTAPSAWGDDKTYPQNQQTPGSPYIFYHQIGFSDTKPTGLRMSACLDAMDECRTDLFALCDTSVESFAKVTDPFTLVVIELRPEIKKLSADVESDGLLYTRPGAKGAILSWMQCEAKFGWPMFPMRTEEQTIHLCGKHKTMGPKNTLCTARFVEAFVDEDTGAALAADKWEKDFEKFWAKVKSSHSYEALNERQLHKLYPSGGKPFTPTLFTSVSWRMSISFGDLWSLLYHAKTPELLWEVNMSCKGPFAELVKSEPDPQAMVVALPKKMQVGTVYEVLCFLDEDSKTAAYVVLPEGSKSPAECMLCVLARYDWQSVPQDGKTLSQEEVEVVNAAPRNTLISFGTGEGAKTSATRVLDLSRCKKLA